MTPLATSPPYPTRFSFVSLCLLFLLFVISPLTVSAAKEPFNVSVSDQSPTISYQPSRSGPADTTWNVTYTESSWSNYVNQTIGQGVSSHYTTHVGANATLGWWGTAVYLWGEAADQDIQVVVDGQVNAKKADGGWTVTGLSEGWHRVRVKVVGGGGVRLYGITFTTGIGESGASPVNSTIQTIFGPNSINGLFGSSTGQWETGTEVGGVAGQSAQPYNRLDTYTAGSQLIFQPPSNTSFILLYGSVNFDHGAFSVSLSTSNLPGVQVSGENADDGAVGDGSSSTTTTVTTIGGIPANQTLRGGSPWVSIDQVIYYASLDPTAQYVVTVENQAKGKQYWDVAKVVFVQAQGGSNSGDSSSNTAAIAGGVAGGVAALGIAGILIWFFVVRKKRQNRQKQEPSNFTQYEDKPFEVDPYRYDDGEDAQTAYANAAAGTHTPLETEGGTPSLSGHGRPDSTLAPLLGHLNSPHSPGRRDSRNSRSSFASASAQSPNPHRLSLPASDLVGGHYNSYFTPSSSRHTSLQATAENGAGLGIQSGAGAGVGAGGMVVHNPDYSPHLEQDEDHHSDHSISPYPHASSNFNTESETTKSRAAGNGSHQIRNREQRRSEIIQERDAGSVPVSTDHPEPVIVPPRYDPSWARERDRAEDQGSHSGGGGELGSEGVGVIEDERSESAMGTSR
ncbi:hypothetical protein I317_07371 [Kwoniella heveanensis CBS 569]|nr:hypothetical protein I317_07371 [Kwoniella heveanensis CBS 569]